MRAPPSEASRKASDGVLGNHHYQAGAFGAAAALTLGLITLGHKAWWFDEAYNVSLARNEWAKYILKAGYYEPSQALYLILFKAWRLVTPETEWFTRLPSVVAAAITAALVGVLGARWFGRRAGALASVLFATNASIVIWSQQARTYTLATLIAVASTILFLNAIEADPRLRKPWLIYGIVGGIGIYAHFFIAFVLVAHLVWLPLLSTHRRRRLREAWAVICIAALPAVVVNAAGENSGADWIRTTTWGQVRDAISEVAGYNAIALVLAGIGAALVVRCTEHSARWKALLLVAWALAPLTGALLVSAFKPLVTGRYLLVGAPAVALLGAAALTSIRPRWIAAIATVSLLLVSGRQIVAWYEREPEDWRAAGAHGKSEERNGATIALWPDANYLPYQLYAPLPQACRRLRGHHEPRCAFSARGERVLLITTESNWRALPGASDYVVTRRVRFGERIRALHLVPGGTVSGDSPPSP
jgi:mannosyltransferase